MLSLETIQTCSQFISEDAKNGTWIEMSRPHCSTWFASKSKNGEFAESSLSPVRLFLKIIPRATGRITFKLNYVGSHSQTKARD